MTKSRFLIMPLVVASLVTGGAVAAKPAAKKLVPQKAQSDVSVTKNADGSVEVRDADAAPEAGAPAGTRTVIYKPAPAATIKYGDGVVVHRNADGSVDVTDEDSMHPVMHSLGPAPVHYASHTHHTAHHAAKPPAKKSK